MPPRIPAEFAIESDGPGAARRLRLSGELDVATAPCLDRALRAADRAAADVVVDLSGLTFLASAGLAVLHEAEYRRRDGVDGRLVLVPGPPSVQQVFEACGLAGAFTFSAGEDERAALGHEDRAA